MEHFRIIAHIENDYKEKFGIPRQSGLVDKVVSRIVFEKEFRNIDAVRGLEDFSHIWLIWVFSEGFASKNTPEGNTDSTSRSPQKSWSPTVRPPRLGGNERIGVWASRSPNRPNPIGLSCVELIEVTPDTPDGPVITVRGADLMDGTPILDIKPYIAYADARPDAACSYAGEAPDTHRLTITGIENLPPDIDKEALTAVLSGDPRPSYQEDSTRVYGISFGSHDIRFTVSGGTLTILGITE